MSDYPAPPVMHPLDGQARTWNMLCHLSALAGFVAPFGNILGPLIVWQLKKNEIPSTETHGKASVNFQITVTIVTFLLGAAAFVLSFFCVGILLIPLVAMAPLVGAVLAILAGIKANNGESFRYPWSMELIK